ncbi:hypothetical protein [Vampirovibrio chlorellavorus]|uniref:hypothetical protein n=1 Tax=Vampirovibrio chlorellavorus TaxID=758823 RepID=UPI0026ECCFE6|nr:hypothetical protein [Vampirovibrio chlorellavorus]
MIPTIGFMIGAYIIVKMFALLSPDNKSSVWIITQLLAVCCIIVAAGCLYNLGLQSKEATELNQRQSKILEQFGSSY